MIEFVSTLENILNTNYMLAPIIALLTGIIFSFSPCSFSQIPLLLVYIAPGEEESKKKIKYTIFYCIGMIVTFVILGIIAALLGKTIQIFGSYIYIILGIILILLGLNMANVFKIPSCKVTKLVTKKKGILGAFIFGIVGGFFSTPCTTPILLAILSIIATTSNIALGIILLLCYGIGHSVIFLVLGISVSAIDKMTSSRRVTIVVRLFKVILSVVVVLFGLYLMYLGF